eukprot:jgi/Psemu1/27914/gm1.27914_g
MEAATNSATWHFYKLELVLQSMPLPEPIETPVFQAAQLHGTYFKYKDEDKRETLDIFQWLPDSCSLGTNDNKVRVTQDPLAFVIQRKRERRKKLAMKATKQLFPSLSKGMVTRSNKLNKGHLCLKWHSATKAQRAQHLVKSMDPGYGWKIEVVRDPTAKPPALPPTPEKIGEADLLNTLDWLVTPLPPKYQNDNHFKQDWFMGIYMQLMTNHCPEWFPIFARDTEDMEASVAGPDIQLAQSWESKSTINSKATWDSQSHKYLHFAKSHPPKGLEKILFQQSDAKTTQESSTWADVKTTQESSDTTSSSWNSPPFDAASPASATTDQLWSVEGAVVTAEKKKQEENTTKPHSLGHREPVIVVLLEASVTILDRTQSNVELADLTL